MPAPPFDIVAFDSGGVLVQIARTWAEAHALAGLAPHPIVTDPRFERRRAALAEAYQIGDLPSAGYWSEVAAASSGAYEPSDVERIHHAWSQTEYEGVGAAVDMVEAAGIATAVLSNTNPAHWARLSDTAEYPTVGRLRQRFASHLLRLAKPDPRAYEALSAATGIGPARILFFDDTPDHVHAARRAGWTAARIDPRRPTAPQLTAALARHGIT